jgi:hypothetical protein
LARQYDVGFIDPNIEVVDVDLAGDRRLMLRHAVMKGAQLNETDAKRVLQHLADLWSYDVSLLIPGGHFDPYLGQFPLAEAAATEWFHEHLLNPNASRP